MSAIERAIQICNGRQKLADAAGVSVQAVHFWASGGRKISAEFVPKIVAATGGRAIGVVEALEKAAYGTILLQFLLEVGIVQFDPRLFAAPENPDFLAGGQRIFVFRDGA